MKSSLIQADWSLDSSISVPHETLEQLIAEESYASLIEHVTIYFDCPFTQAGMTLVDTPGVNSIHGRHTDVAFQQLRKSDAVFYLTYYNHAFSKADQHFFYNKWRK